MLVKHKYVFALKKVHVKRFCVVNDHHLSAINLRCSIVTQHISPLVNSHFWSLEEVPLSVKYLFTSIKPNVCAIQMWLTFSNEHLLWWFTTVLHCNGGKTLYYE